MSLAAQPAFGSRSELQTFSARTLQLAPAGAFPGLRALLWSGSTLYASRGYELFRAKPAQPKVSWESVARFQPSHWRSLTSSQRLTSRLCRDGFHSLAALPSGDLVGAVPGAIVHKGSASSEFAVTHRIRRGTRPLHITAAADGRVFWGEYFDNPHRDEVHIYSSIDRGQTWDVAYTFARGAIRHVHNIVLDEFDGGLWILTGDDGDECRILRASADFKRVEVVLSGDQQARAVALIPTPDAVYFATDTPLQANRIYRLDRGGGRTERVASISSSCIEGCRVGDSIFFTTMVEPSGVNPQNSVHLYGSADGTQWQRLKQWRKDRWSTRFFQYGNAFLPTGQNDTDLLAVSTIAVEPGDLETTLWEVIA
jgi:hypothetical protein